MENKDKTQISDFDSSTLTCVPMEERKSWMSVALIQAGGVICVPSLMLGGLLVDGLTITNAIIAGVVGFIIGITFMTITGFQGSDLGVPTAVCTRSVFGKTGSRAIISTLLVIVEIGWFGIQANVCASAFSSLMRISFGVDIPVWVSGLLWGTIMFITAIFGINALSYLNYIAVPALLVISVYGAVKAVEMNGGLGDLANYVPAHPMALSEGIALAMGYNMFCAVIAADYTRFQRTRADTAKSTYIGMIPAGVALLVLGAIMSLVAGTYDITLIMGEIGVPILGAIILILAAWTTNVTNIYSAGISVVALFNVSGSKRALATMVCGAIGTVLGAMGIMGYLEPILNWMGYLFTPLVGVMIADYFIILKGKAENWKEIDGVNAGALVAWAIGTVASILLDGGFSSVYGAVISVILYVIIMRLIPNCYIGASKAETNS